MDTLVVMLKNIAWVFFLVGCFMVAINWGRLGHTEIPPSLNLRGTIAEKVIWRYLFWSMVVLSSFGVQLASALIN